MGNETTSPALRRIARLVLDYLQHKVADRRSSRWKELLIGVFCAMAAAVLRFLLNPVLGNSLPFTISFPFILLAGLGGGALASFATLALYGLVADFFWLPPEYSFSFTGPSRVLALAVFATAGLQLILLGYLIRTVIGFVANFLSRVVCGKADGSGAVGRAP